MNVESTSRPFQELLYLNVAISEEGLAELRKGRRVVFVPKERVQGIEVRFGSPAERPLIQGILGSVLTAFGLAGVFFLAEGGIAMYRWEAGSLFFTVIGLWLLWETMRRRYYLRVISSNDERKLVFSGKVQKSELSTFLQSATALGYNFKRCINDKKFI